MKKRLLAIAAIATGIALSGCAQNNEIAQAPQKEPTLKDTDLCYTLYKFGYEDVVEFGTLTKDGNKSFYDGRYVTFTDFESAVKIDATKDHVFGISKDGSLIFGKIADDSGAIVYGYGHLWHPSKYEIKDGCYGEQSRILKESDFQDLKSNNKI
ncbi:hypothetical protein KB976_000321 [Vibrio parahaemolyticus]|nr:hypothetical protein [Vibrio parahaemolyticus]